MSEIQLLKIKTFNVNTIMTYKFLLYLHYKSKVRWMEGYLVKGTSRMSQWTLIKFNADEDIA